MAKRKSGGPTRSVESAIGLPVVNAVENLESSNQIGFDMMRIELSAIAESTKSLSDTFAKMVGLQEQQLEMSKLESLRQREREVEASRVASKSGMAKNADNNIGGMEWIIAAVAAAGAFLVGIVQGTIQSLKNTFNAVKMLFKGFGTWFTESKLYENMKTKVTGIFNKIGTSFDDAVKALTGLKDTLVAKIETFKTNIKTKYADILDEPLKSFTGLKESVVTKVEAFKTNIQTKFTSIFSGISTKFDELIKGLDPFVKPFTKAFTIIKESMTSFGTTFDEAKDLITTTMKFIGGKITAVKDFFLDMFTRISRWIGKFEPITGVFNKIGKVIGKLLWPFNLIMSLIDTVSGAMEGYKEGGIMGAIKGGIIGFLSGLIAEPLNLLKDLLSWLAEKVGLESFSKMLDSFDFVKTFKTMIGGIFDGILGFLADMLEYIPGTGGAVESLRGMMSKKGENTPPKQEKINVDTSKFTVTDEDRKTDKWREMYAANLAASGADKPDDRKTVAYATDAQYLKMKIAGETSKAETTKEEPGLLEKSADAIRNFFSGQEQKKGALVDQASRGAARVPPMVSGGTNNNVVAPTTVNNNSSNVVVPPSPKRNSPPVGGMFVDPVNIAA